MILTTLRSVIAHGQDSGDSRTEGILIRCGRSLTKVLESGSWTKADRHAG